MGYFSSWDDFVEEGLQLVRKSPTQTRYTIKYRNCSGDLVLKITDDFTCLKFRTNEMSVARQMEALNRVLLLEMAS